MVVFYYHNKKKKQSKFHSWAFVRNEQTKTKYNGNKEQRPGNKGNKGTRVQGEPARKSAIFYNNFKTQKKMKKSEKDILKHKFKGLPEEEQRTEIVEILDRLTSLGSFITIYAKGLKMIVQSKPAGELLDEEKTVELYDLLGLEIYRSRRLFKRFENDLEVYIDPKNTK